MKILALIQCANLGGMEQSTVLLLDELRRMGHEVELLSLNEMGPLAPVLEQHDIPASAVGYRGKWGWRSFRPLRRRLRNQHSDALVMVGHNLMAMLALGDFCQPQRVLSLHFHHEGVMPNWAWRVLYQVVIWRFHSIIYPSRFIMDEALRIVPGLHRAKRTISYPVPSPIMLPQKLEHGARLSFRAHYGLSPDDPVVGNAGWLIPRKRWDIYLQTAAQVAAQIPKAKFLIAGDGPERADLQRQAGQLGIQPLVKWLGWLKDLEPFYRSLDVMLFNSDWDAMGRTPLEAMSFGVPVVASVVHGGLKEVLDSEACGLLLPAHNVSALAERVVFYLRDHALATRVGEQARRQIEKLGSPRLHAERVMALLQGTPPT
jgi:glycosyltransferase involved in cell wall biosynthesis